MGVKLRTGILRVWKHSELSSTAAEWSQRSKKRVQWHSEEN